jgi:predicted esterase
VASTFSATAARLPEDYDSRQQRYLLYVPPSYHKAKSWPLVVFISPGDDPMGWRFWQKICVKESLLFCAPYQAGNNCPVGRRTRIVLDMLDDVRRHYRIDPEQTYLTGFSGGGRMACTIAFALPEYFGGIMPVCGTNPPPTLTYLRHRAQDRLSVAYVTGATDFNRKENEDYMEPYVRELGIRTRLWVVPKMGHGIPGPDVLGEAYHWLAEDVKRRRADAAALPGLSVKADATPTPAQQAGRQVETAEAELKTPERAWRGVALLKGVRARWPKSDASARAVSLLKEIQEDAKLLERIEDQGGTDERRSLLAQAKGLERFGQKAKALEAWRLLLKLHPDTPAGKQAAEAVRRLEGHSRLTDKPPLFRQQRLPAVAAVTAHAADH